MYFLTLPSLFHLLYLFPFLFFYCSQYYSSYVVCCQYSSVEMGGAEDHIRAKFIATLLVNLRSYAYVMKQADKKGSFRQTK